MGIFDRFKDQAKDKATDISDGVGDKVDEKTGNKYAGQVDQAQQKVADTFGAGDKNDDPAS